MLLSCVCKIATKKMSAKKSAQTIPRNHQTLDVSDSSLLDDCLEEKDIILNAEGGCYSISEVTEELGNISPIELEKLRKTNQLLGLPSGNGYVYPKWQFINHEVLPGLVDVLSKFPYEDPWEKALFILNNNESSDFLNPLSGLRAGKIPQVLNLVKLVGEHGAA
jgi:hypothetical protein